MPRSKASTAPSSSGNTSDLKGRIVILELQIAQLNNSLSQHLTIIKEQQANIKALTNQMTFLGNTVANRLSSS